MREGSVSEDDCVSPRRNLSADEARRNHLGRELHPVDLDRPARIERSLQHHHGGPVKRELARHHPVQKGVGFILHDPCGPRDGLSWRECRGRPDLPAKRDGRELALRRQGRSEPRLDVLRQVRPVGRDRRQGVNDLEVSAGRDAPQRMSTLGIDERRRNDGA